MRIVVVDTSTLLPALFAPGGRRRKLLTVPAYGGIAAYMHIGGMEKDAMRAILEEEVEGARLGGMPIEVLMERAKDARTRLDEFMPAVTPSEFVMAGCPVGFDELEDKIRSRGHVFGVPEDAAKTYRRALLAVTPFIVRPIETSEVRDYNLSDPADNFLIHCAIEAHAEFVISDDKGVAPDGGSVQIDCPATGRSVIAIQPNDFIEDHLNNSNFEVDAVRGELLPLAYRGMVTEVSASYWPDLGSPML